MLIFYFRVDKNQNEQKRKRCEKDESLEELYENNISKIMEKKDGKSLRMMLPIKIQNGVIENRVIEIDEAANEADNENKNDDNQEESQNNDQQENSDIEMDIETPVRFQFIPISVKSILQ